MSKAPFVMPWLLCERFQVPFQNVPGIGKLGIGWVLADFLECKGIDVSLMTDLSNSTELSEGIVFLIGVQVQSEEAKHGLEPSQKKSAERTPRVRDSVVLLVDNHQSGFRAESIATHDIRYART